MEVGMVSRVGVVSDDFRKQVLGYGLTTAQILYRMPDHPSLLQTYVWQNYDLFPKFPALKDFLAFWEEKLEGPLFSVTVAHSKLIKPAELRAVDGVFRLRGNSGTEDRSFVGWAKRSVPTAAEQ
jgi:uncharacterized protein Usg